MKTLYRFLLLFAILLLSHYFVQAQAGPRIINRTVTGFGDREPAEPKKAAMLRFYAQADSLQTSPVADSLQTSVVAPR